MARRHRQKENKLGQLLRMVLLWNLLPLVVLSALGVMWLRGEIQIEALPEGSGFNLGVLGGALVLLLLVASLSLPAAHGAVKRCQQGLAHRRAILAGKAEGSRVASLGLILMGYPAYLLGILIRLVLILLSFALIAIVLVFGVKLFKPEFLEGPIRQIMEYRL